MTILLPAALAGLVLGLAAPETRQSTPAPAPAFRFPKGDAASGQKAFQDLRCHACHAVAGLDLPAPVARPPVPVVLGSKGQRLLTDADLLTAIIDPSHYVAPASAAGETRSGGLSRMGDFSEAMTVRQLIDLVAFIRSRREVAKQDH